MSLASWKREFYPVPASKVPADEALDHSIRKWRGLLPTALERHGCERSEFGEVVGPGRASLDIDTASCALCTHHYWDKFCKNCPLAIARGNVACCVRARGETVSPYHAWADLGDPKPMLVQLRRAKRAAR